MSIEGMRFNRLVAVRVHEVRHVIYGTKPLKLRQWLCNCDCGATKVVCEKALKHNRIRSCGCFRREKTGAMSRKHGFSRRGDRQYCSWHNMISRCTQPRNKGYKNYGGRGITVCERWRDFMCFKEDMGPMPLGMTIDRINVDGNYEPSNCRWASRSEQNRNKRTNRYIEWDGRRQCLQDWAAEIGISPQSLRARLKIHPVEIALTMSRRFVIK